MWGRFNVGVAARAAAPFLLSFATRARISNSQLYGAVLNRAAWPAYATMTSGRAWAAHRGGCAPDSERLPLSCPCGRRVRPGVTCRRSSVVELGSCKPGARVRAPPTALKATRAAVCIAPTRSGPHALEVWGLFLCAFCGARAVASVQPWRYLGKRQTLEYCVKVVQ